MVPEESLSVASDLEWIPVSITEICQILAGSFHHFDPLIIDAGRVYE